ncbi:MAG: L,D-transpeptidase family protein [Smithella sp.]|jgi:murein L,D-transpeptidase YafK/ketosteroid isomerase-like protein
MMIKNKWNIYHIILLSLMFLVYPVEAFSIISADSGKTPDSTASSNSEKITDQIVSPDSENIPDSTATPDSGETSDLIATPDSEKISISKIAPGSRKIPDSIVSLSSGYVIVVDKKYQKIYVFHKDRTFSKVFEASCSTGKHSGSKQVAGDAKTPNGIFFTTKMLRNPGPPEIYGTLAFPLDYPTISDKRAGRDGSNIWIHGTTKSLFPKQSSGCVVLHDSDLRRLANFIYLNRTPVVISESIKWVPQNYVLPSRNELEKILISWNKAFTEYDIKKIDSLYMPGAEIKGKRREDIHNKIKQLKFINKHFVLQPRDISILQEDNNAVIIFDQIYTVSDNNFQGFYNKLILEKTDNKWYIVDDATTPGVTGKKMALIDSKQKGPNDTASKDIRNLITKWLTSWESGDMKTYRDCYASDFQSKEMDLEAWISHKSDVHKNGKNINIRIDHLQISADENTAKALFIQHYHSSKLRSKGKKTLELRKTGDEWKIYREIM